MRPLDLHNPWEGAPILFRERTRSTMEDAQGLARQGYPDGTAVVTDYQESGRGRLEGRQWRSEAGKNLLFTLLLRAGEVETTPFRMPLLVGLAVSRALEAAFGLQPAIKWPNDVLCPVSARAEGSGPREEGLLSRGASWGSEGGLFASEGGVFASEGGVFAKVAGVLCEAVAEGGALVLLAGVGVNCNQRRFPGEPSAMSLSLLLGREVDRLGLLEALLGEIQRTLTDPGWRQALLRRLYLLGREITVRVGLPDALPPRRVSGVLDGLDEDGALRILPASGAPFSVHSGELEVEP